MVQCTLSFQHLRGKFSSAVCPFVQMLRGESSGAVDPCVQMIFWGNPVVHFTLLCKGRCGKITGTVYLFVSAFEQLQLYSLPFQFNGLKLEYRARGIWKSWLQ